MKMRKSQILMIIGPLLLFALFVMPMWQITLGAPQYPEPLGMNIWINKIVDMNPNDLKNINLMNHYIGMAEIPDFIPEFKIFPFIVGFMIILGVLFGLSRKRKLYITWFFMMCILGVLGMYDFWLWEYNYGHNLDSHAAIKFLDEFGNPMAYQPPLIGRKTILNFTATSIPTSGSYFLLTGIFLSLLAFVTAKKEENYSKSWYIFNKKKTTRKFELSIFFIALLSSCSIEPKEINYGSDDCHYCKMHIVDRQHAAEIVTTKGKVFVYDAIECMLNEMARTDVEKYELYLTNVFNTPSDLYNAKECTFLISKALPSPMGRNLTAFKTKELALQAKIEKGGQLYNWNEIKTEFKVMR
jgi:copper chaperone NosL